MLTLKEENDFFRLANAVPRETVEDWIYELHKWDVKDIVFWNMDNEPILPLSKYNVRNVTFLADETQMGSLDYYDPPAWFVYRVLTHKE